MTFKGQQPPRAKRIDNTITQLGRTRTDPYSWLRAPNWKAVVEDPSDLPDDICAYLEAENSYTKAALDEPTKRIQTQLIKEMRARIKEDASTVPQKDGPWAYATRFRPGGEYPIYYRIRLSDSDGTWQQRDDDEILFDGDDEARGCEYFDIAHYDHDPNHSCFGWAVDRTGSEYYTLYIRDIANKRSLSEPIERCSGDFVWGHNSQIIYWVKRDTNGSASQLFRRVLAQNKDTLLYEEDDPAYGISLSYSDTNTYILVTISSHTTSETHYFRRDCDDAATPELKCLLPRQEGHEYDVSEWQDKWIMRTNQDDAIDFKLMHADINEGCQPDDWQEFIPHRPGMLILGVEAFQNYLVRETRHEGLPQIIIRHISGEEHTIKFDEQAYDLGLISGYEYQTDIIRFGYGSPTTPNQVFDYDMATRDRKLLKTQEIPSGHNPSDYITERIFVKSHDGVDIPVTLLRHRTTPLNGTAPLLLYGYGAYGITIHAGFQTGRLSLVDRGFIYAIAHIRGSMAKGYQWYLDGKKEKKTNSFKDFIAVGEYLSCHNYTYRGGIIAMGASAGGLLMGAVANTSPELFGGIIAAVPFVDVINTMSDGDLPLTPPEWPEWGNPLTSKEDYDIIRSYSPYDCVTDKPYPPMLITGGLTDPRVTYWEPSKWIAKLRHEAPNAGPYYLHMNMGAGHGGASGRFEGLKETALEFAFALKCVEKAE